MDDVERCHEAEDMRCPWERWRERHWTTRTGQKWVPCQFLWAVFRVCACVLCVCVSVWVSVCARVHIAASHSVGRSLCHRHTSIFQTSPERDSESEGRRRKKREKREKSQQDPLCHTFETERVKSACVCACLSPLLLFALFVSTDQSSLTHSFFFFFFFPSIHPSHQFIPIPTVIPIPVSTPIPHSLILLCTLSPLFFSATITHNSKQKGATTPLSHHWTCLAAHTRHSLIHLPAHSPSHTFTRHTHSFKHAQLDITMYHSMVQGDEELDEPRWSGKFLLLFSVPHFPCSLVSKEWTKHSNFATLPLSSLPGAPHLTSHLNEVSSLPH